jgi:7-cyano-7-deazaguanine reductase
MVPAGRGAAPSGAAAPAGPIVQENAGRTAPVRTYQDLLRNASDEALFTHYFTSQLAIVPLAGSVRTLGAPGILLSASPSPDGRYILQTRVKRPFSYVVPAPLFPAETIVSDLGGRMVHRLADLPLRDDIPTQFDAVAPGPRSAQWRSDKPSSLVWVEAQDGGDARREAAIRDRVLMLDAPFTGQPRKLVDLKDRYSGIVWGRDDHALVLSRWWNTRKETRIAVNPSQPGQGRVLLERNFQDRYNDPGMPVMRLNAAGRPVMQFTADRRGVFMTAPGASREGEFPFLARMDLASGESQRLWQAKTPYYESLVALLDDNGERLLTRRESRIDPPNLFLRTRSGGEPVQITRFPDPAPQLAGVTQKLVTYKRPDGVELSGTLYLPAGYDQKRDGPLPLLMWAYPAEFTDAAVAGQVVDTQNRFTRPGGSSHLFLLTQGYAILDDPTMPIVGANGAEPNDTYVQQLVASAQAAVDAVVAMGVADRRRIAVGGHSYGAFMTANLLAHSDLFRTGIARSGAYNRTLTPFGFQAEQRSYWEAVDTYTQMSPFTHVQKIKEPILLIHGEADDNSGTFPVQSERFYAALKGQGANVRYVVLPLEAHGYRARESVMHTLWEMTRWLDRHVKAAPRTTPRARSWMTEGPPPGRRAPMAPKHLGQASALPASPEDAELDYVPNPRPGKPYLVRFTAPEFTSLCPVTGQPDFAHLVIDYAPGETIVESKSLKLFLGAFRNHCGFHEDVTVGIGERLADEMKPLWLRIGGYWYPRGGMPIDVFWQTGEPPVGLWVPSQDVPGYRGRG